MPTRHPEGIERLILDRKGDRTYERLSRDCGGFPGEKRLQQMVNRPIRNFPDPETLQGLSRGLNVPVMQVLAAIAHTLGIRVTTAEDPDNLVLVGAARLPQSSQDLLVSMAREMLYLRDQAAHPEHGIGPDELELAASKGSTGISPYELPE